MIQKPKYTIFSLPRCGSTSLAEIISLDKTSPCLIEPFHPSRHKGDFADHAQTESGLGTCLRLIDVKWRGIKHVAEPSGFPFKSTTQNFVLLGYPERLTIFIERKNLLQRAVSHWLSRHTRFWMGERATYLKRLADADLSEISLWEIQSMIEEDREFNRRCKDIIAALSSDTVLCVTYEQLFRTSASVIDRFRPISKHLNLEVDESFWGKAEALADPNGRQFANDDVYKSIPALGRIDRALSSNENGYLFAE